MVQAVSTALARLIGAALPFIDSRAEGSEQPYAGRPAMVPHRDARRQAMVHYGAFIPDLPAPYRYLNTMTLIGATGTEIFDNDHLAAADARDTATVFSSTAHGDQQFYEAFDASTDCDFAADGSHLRWGEALTIDVANGTARITGRYGTFDVDLALTVSDQVSYFVRNVVYDHLSLLAPYTGTITDADGVHEVSGLGTFEYAHAIAPQALSAAPLPPRLKLPADFFTYQVVDLDERTQLLLTAVSARGVTLCLTVHVRVLGESTRYLDDVDFEIVEFAETDMVDPVGRSMRVPRSFRWRTRDEGRTVVDLTAQVDAPWRFGHGRGYAGAYTFVGTVFDDEVTGNGYIEWSDVQQAARRVWSAGGR